MGSSPPAGAALDQGGPLRGPDRRPACGAAAAGRAARRAHCDRARRAHLAEQRGERRSGRLGRPQGARRQQGAHRRGYPRDLLALCVTAANGQERAQVTALAAQVQEATGENVELAYVDEGYRGEDPARAATAQGTELIIVRHSEPKRAFVLLPKRSRGGALPSMACPLSQAGLRLRAASRHAGGAPLRGFRLHPAHTTVCLSPGVKVNNTL